MDRITIHVAEAKASVIVTTALPRECRADDKCTLHSCSPVPDAKVIREIRDYYMLTECTDLITPVERDPF